MAFGLAVTFLYDVTLQALAIGSRIGHSLPKAYLGRNSSMRLLSTQPTHETRNPLLFCVPLLRRPPILNVRVDPMHSIPVLLNMLFVDQNNVVDLALTHLIRFQEVQVTRDEISRQRTLAQNYQQTWLKLGYSNDQSLSLCNTYEVTEDSWFLSRTG
jgi:hypothetical protein